jgi:hypothetical protein
MEETSTVDDTAAALAIQPHPLADKRSPCALQREQRAHLTNPKHAMGLEEDFAAAVESVKCVQLPCAALARTRAERGLLLTLRPVRTGR